MDYKKKKRNVKSVQDMMGIGMDVERSKHKSNYQGPYKKINEPDRPSGGSYRQSVPSTGMKSAYKPMTRTGGFQDFAWIIFSSILVVCIIITCIVYSRQAKASNYTYPLDVVTMTGVLNTIYEADTQTAASADSTQTDSAADTGQTDAASTDGTQTDGTQTDAAAADSTQTATSGASMVLDSGEGMTGYTEAASYTELLSQLEGALAAEDSAFVGSKLSYKDETSGALTGYPQSIVEYFTSYMAANSDKRTLFMESIQDEATYAGQNGTAYVVVLPVIQYTVKTSYDNTTFSFSGFSEQTINTNQTATVSPMLPCMYTVTASNAEWEQVLTSEMEAKFGENLELNFGVNE
ncbi:MAG TPA: hypothetical protein PLU43_09930 [Lachnospiraceae bacterium]|nr:hypothetical protein [Lachnospiraceae bacterium]